MAHDSIAAPSGGGVVVAAVSQQTDVELQERLQRLEAAIGAGDVEAARMLARELALRNAPIEAEVDREAAAATLKRQLQAKLIGMGHPPGLVVQALRKGGAQSVEEALTWLGASSSSPAGSPVQVPVMVREGAAVNGGH
mmetsp:Transcript_1570/g.1127  ORF Transcript_1570/g.1127 Transcript_1570/m.1127 type:complete len:139 (-) Transcript_1570:69-485(-)